MFLNCQFTLLMQGLWIKIDITLKLRLREMFHFAGNRDIHNSKLNWNEKM